MKATPVIILTRPMGAATRLAECLSQIGPPVLVCPTLRIDTAAVVAADLGVLGDIDLVFFVSGAAVRAFGEQLVSLGMRLSPLLQIAAVGLSTASEISRVFGRTDVILPAQGDSEDSESLWRGIIARGALPRHVLIVRGQSGRDWFAEQLHQHGIQVSIHAAYCRTQATWDDGLVSRLQAFSVSAHLPVFVCTSAQGILALACLAREHGIYPWCREGRFVVTHSRHQEIISTQFLFSEAEKNRRIFLSGIQDNAILDTLKKVCKSVSCN